jgi:hypothetical protein
MIFAGATLTIDDPEAGGSDARAWATAIAHTPHLANQIARERTAAPVAHEGEAGVRPPIGIPASPIVSEARA